MSADRPRVRDAGNDATKGLLIALVALGHCFPAQRVLPWVAQGGLYDFHVIGFLLLPFLRPAAPCTVRFVLDRAVRYLVPFVVFALLSCAAWQLTLHPPVAASALPLALIRGDVVALAQGVGFTFLWFMPALLSLAILRSLVAGTRPGLRLILGAAVIALHGLIAATYLPLPLNPLPALFVLPLGWALAVLARRPPARWLWLLLAVLCGVVAWRAHHHINVAALSLPSWRTPHWLLLHDVYAVAATLAAIQFGPALARVPGLVPIGRYSLAVFLSHQFFLKFAEMALARQTWGNETWALSLVALLAVPGSLAFGWLVAQLLDRPAIRPWILPQTAAEWPPTARFTRRTPVGA